MKIAIVVQRYGLDVCGGSEFYARRLALLLSKNAQVEVITTTAMDYLTWKPYYKEGIEEIEGIKVNRFNVNSPKNPKMHEYFTRMIINRYNYYWLTNFKKFHPNPLHKLHPLIESTLGLIYKIINFDYLEDLWMKKLGPYSSSMLKYIEKSKNEYDIFIFVTYLYSSTFYGLQVIKDKSILIPTAHDETPIFLKLFKKLFLNAKAFIFLTLEEKEFINKVFETNDKPDIVAGIDIQLPESLDYNIAFKEFPNLIGKKYILFVGRMCQPKNTHILIDYFNRYIKKTNKDIYLVLAGKKDMDIPESDKIILTGFVSEEIKYSLYKNAALSVNPSYYESLSIILLESWLMETPVIVNEKCEVLAGQIKRSKGGFTYKDFESFCKSVDFILDNKDEASLMGKNGKKYTIDNYSRDVVENNILKFLKGLQ